MLSERKVVTERHPTPLHNSINEALIKYLRQRRSVSANALTEPGPDAAMLQEMLTIAARVPDHKKLAPWRFLVFAGEARADFGHVLAEICARKEPEATEGRLAMERGRFLRAPVVVAVVSSPKPHPAAPEWEQILSAACVSFNLLNAAFAFGFAANWITEWYAYDEDVKAALGLQSGERIAGFVYIGTPKEVPQERDRPDIAAITRYWKKF